jgi:hypothetical protein
MNDIAHKPEAGDLVWHDRYGVCLIHDNIGRRGKLRLLTPPVRSDWTRGTVG